MRLIATFALVTLLSACAKEESLQTGLATVDATPEKVVDEPMAARVLTREVREVECGCRIEAIKKCGNYLALDGAYLPIAKEGAGAELGVMEWCGAPGSTAECEGEVKDGRFIASYLQTVTS